MKNVFIPLLLAGALIACERQQQIAEDKNRFSESIGKADSQQIAPQAENQAAFSRQAAEPEPKDFAQKLAQAALERTMYEVIYDGSYRKISYPLGDVPAHLGVCTDVIIRTYRSLGIDLQQLVHEDMKRHFRLYPNQKRWGLRKPDPNIDHRRVPNLRVFFSRHGESLPVTDEAHNYKPGDLVTWKLNDSMVHIGIVAQEKSYTHPERHLIIHNIGRGPELSDMLFDFVITGHYRFHPGEES